MHRLTIALFAIPLLVSPLWAHHSFAAEFDAQKPVTLKGTVVKWEMINPHGWITVDVTGRGRRESPVDGRDLESERADAAWLDKEFAETGRSDHRRGIQGQGRIEHSKRCARSLWRTAARCSRVLQARRRHAGAAPPGK